MMYRWYAMSATSATRAPPIIAPSAQHASSCQRTPERPESAAPTGTTISTSVFERVPKIIGAPADARGVRSEEVRQRLRALGVRASKGLGQHFLVDERIADGHVELARIDRSDTILEVGPGLGGFYPRARARGGAAAAGGGGGG